MEHPLTIPGIRNITVSGRIATGATTLAKQLATQLHWDFWEVGKLDEEFYKSTNTTEVDVAARPDEVDVAREEAIKKKLQTEHNLIIQSHLAGFNAQGITGVYKFLVICEDEEGQDKTDIRIDRLVNRKGITVEEAKHEIKFREKGLLEKWSRLYAHNDPTWYYWDRKYYDFVINSYIHNQEESLQEALRALGIEK